MKSVVINDIADTLSFDQEKRRKMNGNNKGGIVAILAILSIAVPLLTAQAALADSAYSRGYSDARCDKNSCHGHGFDPSCPSGHTGDFCANYAAGYRAGWNAGSGGGGGSQNPQCRAFCF